MRLIDADAMLARLEEWNTSDSTDKALYNFTLHRILEQPTIEPERKDALEKAVAVEAICDELMSRFDISATYAYEIAEKAMNRIEAMAKEIGKR